MNNRKPDALNFLVTDYDQCAITFKGTHPKLLSKSLIKHAKESKYDGFYGCTHRGYLPCKLFLFKGALKKTNTTYTKKNIEENYPTYKITANFAEATQLTCQAVSTIDDLVGNKCGVGFDTILKPYEAEAKEPSTGFVKDWRELTKSKNLQLMQIAKHASANYPNVKITLTYVDDKVALCKDALLMDKLPEWPKHMSIKVFNHEADSDDAEIVAVTAKPTAEKTIKTDGLNKFGTFSKATRSSTQVKLAEFKLEP